MSHLLSTFTKRTQQKPQFGIYLVKIHLVGHEILLSVSYFLPFFEIPAGIWCKNDVVLTLIRRHFRTKCPLGWQMATIWIFHLRKK